VRGRGLLLGLALPAPGLATAVARAAFARGLVIETAGPRDEVLKIMPPLIIDDDGLRHGLETIAAALDDVLPAPTPAEAIRER
jgi:diaminobutyrate-2-oxoglutarate transaminase